MRASTDEPAADHCPFLNRRDKRCGEFLSIERLCHAFEHCFDQYQTCPVYFDQLIERRARRGEVSQDVGSVNPTALVQVTISRALRADRTEQVDRKAA